MSSKEGVPGREEPRKLRRSMKARQVCVGLCAGKARLCVFCIMR